MAGRTPVSTVRLATAQAGQGADVGSTLRGASVAGSRLLESGTVAGNVTPASPVRLRLPSGTMSGRRVKATGCLKEAASGLWGAAR